MPKRKCSEDENEKEDDDEDIWESTSIPLPIQTFLWRQTSPFIRPKISRLQDAAAMEQREACKLFEKVLVQNIQFGLSPSLTEAIHSVSRWRLIVAALPHVMHCCAALLYTRRKSSFDKLSASETKLLYTLHWIILDAAEECADAETESGIHRLPEHYLLPVTTIQTFVYLFAPLIPHLKQSDFLTSFRLENGYKIWIPLFNFCHPEIPSFIAHAKKDSISSSRVAKKIVVPKFGDVFIGSTNSDKPPSSIVPCPTVSFAQITSPSQPFACESPVKDSLTKEELKKKFEFSEKHLSEPLLATYLDVAVIRCLFTSQWIEEGIDWALNFINCRLETIRKVTENRKNYRHRSNSLPIPKRKNEESFLDKQESKTNRPKSEYNNENTLSTSINPQQKTSSFQELRRSSFSGLPGLSGFQALISSTSSASFGRHGSEKSKHKKHKKHTSEAVNTKSDNKQKQSEHSLCKESKHRNHHHKNEDIKSNKLKLKKEKIDSAMPTFEHSIYEPERPNSVTDKSSLKSRQFSLSDTRLLDKNDQKGKSMPSLHLLSTKNDSCTIESKQFASIYGLAQTVRSPTKTSLTDNMQNVPFPIITITEHSPIASMQFFHSDQESRKEIAPSSTSSYKFYIGEENTIPTISQPGLPRSKTDSEINYSVENSGESLASLNYVTKNGNLSLVVILKAIHSIILKDSVCSLRICKIIYNILNKLLNFKIIPKHASCIYQTKTHRTFKPNCENMELCIHHLFMDTLFRIIKQLGCSRGCGEGHRDVEAIKLKDSVMKTLKILHEISEYHFLQYCEMLVVSHPIQEVIDIFHAFLGFCLETSMTSSSNTHLSAFPFQKLNHQLDSLSSGLKSGYLNNFSAEINSNKVKTIVETIIIKCIFKPFVNRMVFLQKELNVQENMSLYCEIRQFISYVRNHHGSTFRNVALSGLIESTKYILQNEKMQSTSKQPNEIADLSTLVQCNLTFNTRSMNNHKFLENIQKTDKTNDQSIKGFESNNDWVQIGHEFQFPRNNSPISEEEMFSKNSKIIKKGITNWFKSGNKLEFQSIGADLSNVQHENANLHNYLNVLETQPDKLVRRESFSRQTIKNYPNQNMINLNTMSQKSTFSKAKKRMDQFRNVFGKNKVKQSSFEETPDISRKNSVDFDQANESTKELIIHKSKTVPLQILKDGMLKFQFLLESCTPGTIPDAQLVAAMLDLKAPIIARAAFLIECSHFVHRCNKGQWPSWMRMNFNFFRPSVGPRSGSQTVVKSRASTTLQRAAGKAFYQWGELLSSRLEDLLQIEINSMNSSTNTSIIEDGGRVKQMARLSPEEQFLCFNSKESDCPFALKLIACQLLYEITTFIRETYQYLPAKSSRRPSIAAKDRVPVVEAKPVSTNRRWSMALSNVGLSNSPGYSLMSLANSGGSHMLDHGSNINERRISFVLHEADVENDSNSATSNDDLLQDRRRLSQVGPNLLRKLTGGGHDSFRRRSIKLKKIDKKSTSKLRSATFIEDDYKMNMFKRSNSLRSRRKISGVSEKSDTSDRFSEEDESPSLLSDDGPRLESQNDALDTSDTEIVSNIPWLKTTTIFYEALDFSCQHNCFCSTNCYKKVIKSTYCLIKEVQRIYEKDVQPLFDSELMSQKLIDDKDDAARKEKKLKKILMGHSSPLKRKTSVGHNFDKHIDRDNHSHNLHSTNLFYNAADIELGLSELDDPRYIFFDVFSYKMEMKQEDNLTMLYCMNQVKNPFHSIISMFLKSALILNNDQFEYLLNISWNLVLDEDVQISSTASVAVILCALKRSELVIELINSELNNSNVDTRVNTINKFFKLWSNRYQCWQRLEEGAQLVLKLPPAAIEFTLPSPRVALECKPMVDPPYMPVAKTRVDEVAINQEPAIQKSFVAATKTRRKQQIEIVTRALQEQEDKMRDERESYRLNSVPITLQAAYEPALFHTIEDHDDNEDEVERIPLHHMQVAQSFFPSSLTTASLSIINLLEDNQVCSDGNAVYEIAYKVVWQCLIEEPSLFLRNLLEKLTREKKSVIIQTIRRLIRFLPRLPSQAAYILYNYLIGFIMHHVRTPYEDSQEIIASVISVIWLIVPNVYGLFLKDLKQILRKEQCDSTILITANVPSAKKIIVHGPDSSLIPSQFPIHEDTQFSQILTDSLDFFGIDESKHNEYFLVDSKTNQIHNLNAFVRDFYFFKRSQYPQISLVHMNPSEAYDKFQKQAFTLQFTELGKCLMSLSLIKTSFLSVQRVLFLHEELMKLPSFPRKALETNLTLYSGPMGKEVLGIDTLHKVAWVKLVARMFDATTGFFAEASDIHLFLNVVNGTLLLHCEDSSIVRLCMATYINAAHQFKNIFATNGYLLIVQTMVQIYTNHQTNSLLCRTIEFVFKQFYILHRKPFVLQMFGAVSPLLEMNAASSSHGTVSQIHPKAFFQLLQSLGQYTADPLDILELVDAEKPLKALDFCYQMDSEALTILDAISLCVTVISYASDSERGHQMLTVLDAVLPFHLRHMQSLTTKKETPGGPRTELQMIHSISVCMKTLIYNCEALTRNFTGPQKSIEIRETSVKNASPQLEIDEDSHSKYNVDNYYSSHKYNRNMEIDDGELSRLDFRKPRDLLLKIVSEFLSRSAARLADLSKKIPDLHQKNSCYELLDVKCHLRLAEIAHSLLKLAPYDPQTMACNGLVRYMNEILPNSEWRQEKMRPALIMVLRRLDKTFTKISKKSVIKRQTDWEAAKLLLKGVYLTFMKHPYIVHLPHLKSLITVCQNIILGDQIFNLSESSSSAFSSWTIALSQAPPPGFTSVAVRLISLQMIQQGDSQSLDSLCSGAFSSPEKSEIYLMNMIYPLCIRITSGLKDIPKLRQCDINFVLTIILNILKPINTKGIKGSDSSQVGMQLKQFSLQQIGFLGLKILITCFEKQLTTEWYRISKCIRDLADKPQLVGSTFWNFLDFVSTYRTPLFILILPYIKCKYLSKICDNEIELAYRNKIREKLNGIGIPLNRSKGNLLVTLVTELKSLREELIRCKNNPYIEERSRSIIQEPNSTGTSEKPETSGHRLSFAISQIAASASKLSNISSSNSNNVINTLSNNTNEQVPLSPSHSTRSILLRGLSFRLGSDSRRLASRGLSVKLTSNQADKKMFTRRTSYPDQSEAIIKENECLKESHSTHSEPKLYRRSTIQGKSTRLISPSSLSGETLNENEENCATNSQQISHSLSKEEIIPAKHRLQRQKAQSRKSFRLRKSQRPNERSFIKSETIDLSDDSKHHQFSPTLKKENDSITSSPGCTSFISLPRDKDCENDNNGNLHSVSFDSGNEKTALLKSIENQENNNTTNNRIINSNSNNAEYSLRIINDLGLTLNRLANTDNSTTLSPFESSLTTLPFADEDV